MTNLMTSIVAGDGPMAEQPSTPIATSTLQLSSADPAAVSTTNEGSAPLQALVDQPEDQALTTEHRVSGALALVWQELASRASEAAFLELLAEVYGATNADAKAFTQRAGNLANRLAAGDTLGLRYEIETGAEMGGARGAYAVVGDNGVPTIYINGDWLTNASDAQLQMVLLEEIGHALDRELNGSTDTAGDEGALFAQRIRGIELSEQQRLALLAENDGAVLSIDGQQVSSELSGNPPVANDDRAAQFRVNTTTTSDQNYPSTTALADGGFLVTWSSLFQDGSSWGIYGQRYNAAGAAVGGEFRVNTTTFSDQIDSSTTALTDGGFLVTWSSYGQDGSGYGIYGQRYNAAGAAVGGEFRVNTTTTSDQNYPSTTALADGGFLVTWSSLFQDGSSYGIYGQRYNAAGAAVGGEFRVNTTTFSDQIYSSTTALTDGGFLVTWSSNGQDGSGSGSTDSATTLQGRL